jgi:LPS export ABC transporter protein LptC
MNYFYRLAFLVIVTVFCAACSFDYGETAAGESPYPDITMEDLEYVRVRNGNPIARLQAEAAERYEKRRRMELKNYSFEQYNIVKDEADAIGSGGFASIELDTSNIHMSSGVEIIVDSEDLILITERLDWDDGKKSMTGGDNDSVSIEQSNGTEFAGTGFSADVRSRSWFFSSEVGGKYVHEDVELDKEDADGEDADGEEADEMAELTSAGESAE